MTSRAVALIVCLALVGVGCTLSTPLTYHHPTKALADRQKDLVECAALAGQASTGAGEWSSDRAVRSAVQANVRDQYFATCLESRGWVAGAPPPPTAELPSATPTERRVCAQQALYLLNLYDGPRTGEDSPLWQQAVQRYQIAKGIDDVRVPAAMARDLEASGIAENIQRCLTAEGPS